jgi:CsoR family transcriptional regulator, copper-sensing transcriptional repressor
MKKIDDPKKQASIALKKAQTHIKNILDMIDNDEYCIDILTQISAVNGLVKSASDSMLKNHMRTCFMHGMATDDNNQKEALIGEVLNVINLSGKK